MRALVSSNIHLPLPAHSASGEVPGAQNLNAQPAPDLDQPRQEQVAAQEVGSQQREWACSLVNASIVTRLGTVEPCGTLCPPSCCYPVARTMFAQIM